MTCFCVSLATPTPAACKEGRYRAALLMGVILCLALLGGCGGGNGYVSPSSSPSLARHDLNAGDRVSLASGLTMVVPSGLFGELALNYPGGPREHLGLGDGETGPAIVVESLSEQDVSTLDLPGGNLDLIARSADGSIEVRWMSMVSPPSSFTIITTRLPGHLTGIVIIGDMEGKSAALTAAAAYRQVVDIWKLLSIDGAELPEFSPAESSGQSGA